MFVWGIFWSRAKYFQDVINQKLPSWWVIHWCAKHWGKLEGNKSGPDEHVIWLKLNTNFGGKIWNMFWSSPLNIWRCDQLEEAFVDEEFGGTKKSLRWGGFVSKWTLIFGKSCVHHIMILAQFFRDAVSWMSHRRGFFILGTKYRKRVLFKRYEINGSKSRVPENGIGGGGGLTG